MCFIIVRNFDVGSFEIDSRRERVLLLALGGHVRTGWSSSPLLRFIIYLLLSDRHELSLVCTELDTRLLVLVHATFRISPRPESLWHILLSVNEQPLRLSLVSLLGCCRMSTHSALCPDPLRLGLPPEIVLMCGAESDVA